jgi:hypothetical protein
VIVKILGVVATVIELCIMGALWTVAASAHDAPTGWSYPAGCCAGSDCREVPDSAISEPSQAHQIYIIKATGEMIPPGDARIKPSPDGRFHWCSVNGRDDSRTICLFVPPKGF